MKLQNTTIIYIYAVVLFVLTYLLATRLISSFKSNEFDYLKIGINVALIIYIVIKVVALGKAENNKNV